MSKKTESTLSTTTKGTTMKTFDEILKERREARKAGPRTDSDLSTPVRGVLTKVSTEINALALGIASDFKDRRAQGMLF
jgi:hypothetical protein